MVRFNAKRETDVRPKCDSAENKSRNLREHRNVLMSNSRNRASKAVNWVSTCTRAGLRGSPHVSRSLSGPSDLRVLGFMRWSRIGSSTEEI